LIDFGLAVKFENLSKNEQYLCKKYVVKTHYKAPKVYGKKLTFDARKADIWSLGVSFFMMIVGAPPYKLPLDSDDHFPFIQGNDVNGILKRWGREQYIDKKMENLLNCMLQIDERKRYTVHDIERHLTAKPKHRQSYNHLHRRSHHVHSSYRAHNHSSHRQSKSDKRRKSKARRKKKPSNPILHGYVGDDDALMKHAVDKVKMQMKNNSHNIFQHLVDGSDVKEELFRYRKRRMDSPST
jgi:serine/threonine protein kinase